MSETVGVDRNLYGNYLSKGEQLLNAMEEAGRRGEWDACVLNAVHSSISFADAFCIYSKGMRNASQRHAEAIRLFIDCGLNDGEVRSNATRLSRLIGIKNDVAYGERMARKADAESAMLDARRLASFVRERLPK